VGEPVRVSEARIGQSPNVVWDGNEVLVTYETPRDGTYLVAFDRGRVAWTELIAGTNAEIAWNPRTRSGLVVTSETITWLGRDGKPVHHTSAPHVTNIGFHGGVTASGDGFIVASGVGSHASSAQPIAFSIARIGAPTDAIEWKRIDDDGLRYAPLLSGALVVSQPFKAQHGVLPAAQIFALTNDPPSVRALDNAPSTRAVAFDPPHVVFSDDTTHALSVTSSKGIVDLGVRSTRSGSAVLLHVGERLVLGADKIGDSIGVALAALEIDPNVHVGTPLAIGPESSQHLRATATDRGFVAAWNIADDGAPLVPLMNQAPMHGLSTMVVVYTCCP
jgi:hypothetical protein